MCNPATFLEEYKDYKRDVDNMRGAVTKLNVILKTILRLPDPKVVDVERLVGLRRIMLPTREVQWMCEAHACQKPKGSSMSVLSNKYAVSKNANGGW